MLTSNIMNFLSTTYQCTATLTKVLMNREPDNMSLVPQNFDPEYLVEEINNRQHLIAKTTAKQYPLSV